MGGVLELVQPDALSSSTCSVAERHELVGRHDRLLLVSVDGDVKQPTLQALLHKVAVAVVASVDGGGGGGGGRPWWWWWWCTPT